MNPWLLLAAALAIGDAGGCSCGCGFMFGHGVDIDSVDARNARDDQVAQQTRNAAAQGTAEAIAKLKPVNKTIVQRAEKEI